MNPKPNQPLRKITWIEFTYAVDALAHNLQRSQNLPVSLYPVNRGGLVPTAMLSHQLNVPITLHLHSKYFENTLVVDDIADRGLTLSAFHETGLATASVFVRHNASFVPRYWGEMIMNDDWIVFPWEVLEQTSEGIRTY